MIQRCRLALLTLAVSLPLAACMGSTDHTTSPLDQAEFERAVAAGGPVVLDFYADWCPTCKQQQPIVRQLMSEPRFKEVKLFVANFDQDKAIKKRLGVSAQSTFVAFKGGQEVARSTGQTTREAIEATFAKAL